MSFLFAKSPEKLVKEAESELLCAVEMDEKMDKEKKKTAQAKCTAMLGALAEVLFGRDEGGGAGAAKDADPKAARQAVEALAAGGGGALYKLLGNFRALDFEGKKLVTRIFEYALAHHRDIAERFVLAHADLLAAFVRGYADPDGVVALCFDSCFRACVRDERLCEEIFKFSSPNLIDPFFKFAELPNFEILSHALSTFRLLLTEHKSLAAAFLYKNFDKFFENFNRLLMSKNYVTRCEAFKLLGDLLVIRANFDVMVRYIAEVENLKLAMTALRAPGVTVALQVDVFHVLKLFIANPDKSEGVLNILTANRRGLVEFFTRLETSDERVVRDKAEVLKQLNRLAELAKEEVPAAAAPSPARAEAAQQPLPPQAQARDPTPAAAAGAPGLLPSPSGS